MTTISADHLLAFATEIFVASGTPASDAQVLSRLLVDANLMGLDSHGIQRVPQYVQDIELGAIKPGAEITVARKGPTTAVVDGHWNFGQVGATRAAEVAIEMAAEHGMGCVVLHRCRHVGRLGAYTEMAAERDCIAMAGATSAGEGHWVAPFGGRQGRLGTNPLAFAAPTGDQPIAIDFSTSSVPEGKVRLLRDSQLPLPAACLVNEKGQPSTDPGDLYQSDGTIAGAILPFGGNQGYKGFALGLMVTTLSAVLGGPVWRETGVESFANPMWLLVMDLGAFMDPATFREQMDELVQYVRSSAPAEGSDGVRMPGQREFELREQRRAEGIEIDENIWSQVITTADKLGVKTVAR